MIYRALEEVSGVGPVAAKILKDLFVTTAELLAIQDPTKLDRATRLGEGTTNKIVQNARELVGLDEVKNGSDVDVLSKATPRLRTGLVELDEKIMGGFPEASIIEVYGPARSNKSQLCHQLALMTTLPEEMGGFDKNTLWLSTERSFRPLVFRLMAHRFGVDPEDSLSRVTVMELDFMTHLLDQLPRILAFCNKHNIGLVVLDSISFPLWTEHAGLHEKRYGERELIQFMKTMRRFTKVTGTIFIYTNQVFYKNSCYGGYDNAPMGGHVLSHASDYRFYVRFGKDDERRLRLKDNPELPPFDVTFRIGWGGLYDDYKEKKDAESGLLAAIENETGMKMTESLRMKHQRRKQRV